MSETSSVDLTNYETSDLLVFTDAAANKVKNLIEEENNDELKLRVFVSGGGCSGFQYGFTFDENVQDGDTKIEKNGVMLLVDPMSFQYLSGAEIDYKEDAYKFLKAFRERLDLLAIYKNALEWAKDYPKAKIIKQAWPCTDNLGKYDCFFHDPYIEDASEELLKYNCTNIYFLIKCIKELANKDSRFSFFCAVTGENNTIGQYFDRLQRTLVDECPNAEYKISVYQYDSTNVPEHCNYTNEGWLFTPLIQVQQ